MFFKKRKIKFQTRLDDLFEVLIFNFSSVSLYILLVLFQSQTINFISFVVFFLNLICFSFHIEKSADVLALHTYSCHLVF